MNAVPEGSKVLSVTHRRVQTSTKSDVDIVPLTRVSTALCGCACTRKEVAVVMTMDGEVQNMRIFIKHLLCSVTMVNIPIYDQHL